MQYAPSRHALRICSMALGLLLKCSTGARSSGWWADLAPESHRVNASRSERGGCKALEVKVEGLGMQGVQGGGRRVEGGGFKGGCKGEGVLRIR